MCSVASGRTEPLSGSDSDPEPELGPAYYEAHADGFGWGPAVGALSPARAEFLDRFAVGTVVDVGCGAGMYVDHLAKGGHDATGVDRVRAFVEHAQVHRQGTFVEADAYTLPFADGHFDTGIAFDILEHVDDERVLREIVRVTRKRVLLCVPLATPEEVLQTGLLHTHYRDRSHLRYYDEDRLRTLVEGAGLEVLTFDTSDPVYFRALMKTMLTFRRRIWRSLFYRLLRKAEIRPLPATLFVAAAHPGTGRG